MLTPEHLYENIPYPEREWEGWGIVLREIEYPWLYTNYPDLESDKLGERFGRTLDAMFGPGPGGDAVAEELKALYEEFERTIETDRGYEISREMEWKVRFSKKYELWRAAIDHLTEYPFLADDVQTLRKIQEVLCRKRPQRERISYALGVSDGSTIGDAFDDMREDERLIRDLLEQVKVNRLRKKP